MTDDNPYHTPPSTTCCEIKVILKGEERSYRQKFLVYDRVTVDPDDHTILKCIAESALSFQGEPDSITVQISLEIK